MGKLNKIPYYYIFFFFLQLWYNFYLSRMTKFDNVPVHFRTCYYTPGRSAFLRQIDYEKILNFPARLRVL